MCLISEHLQLSYLESMKTREPAILATGELTEDISDSYSVCMKYRHCSYRRGELIFFSK